MQRAAFVLRLYPDKIEAYRETHRAVWQEMIDANREAGIRNHTCFLHENLVICYLECDDLEQTQATLAKSDVVRRWGELHAEIIDSSDGGERVYLENVFHQD
ncbi:MAG TPA: L-rhamnose mutarotase [Chloroflexota bacterium]|nr:L-rhamnose mutarotase [Chloroflexota bacterium]